MWRVVILSWALTCPALAAAGLQDGKAAYEKGRYKTALKEFGKLAERGDAEAQALLANMYETGNGVKIDVAIAAEWYRKAAEQGNANAQSSLGTIYQDGKGGFPQDYAKAAEWFRKAAEQGNSYGQLFLGRLYEQGRGVPQDFVMAYKWMALSAAASDSYLAGAVIVDRDAVAAKMTSAQIEEAQRLAREWTETRSKAKP